MSQEASGEFDCPLPDITLTRGRQLSHGPCKELKISKSKTLDKFKKMVTVREKAEKLLDLNKIMFIDPQLRYEKLQVKNAKSEGGMDILNEEPDGVIYPHLTSPVKPNQKVNNFQKIVIDDTLKIDEAKFNMKNKISIKEGLAKKSGNDKIESWNEDCLILQDSAYHGLLLAV